MPIPCTNIGGIVIIKKFWIGLAVGALVGGAAALLFAPQSGPSARRKLKRSFEDLGDNLNDAAEYLKEQTERLAKEAQKLVDGSKGQMDEAFDMAQAYTKTAGSRTGETASRLM